MRVSHVDANEGGPVYTDAIYDAFEGREHGLFVWSNQEKNELSELRPIACFVKPLGKNEIRCTSPWEFEELAEKHFGLGR
jgi:hypothetical protein